MTVPKENSQFCFPETLNVGTLEHRELRGNKTDCFPRGLLPNSKIEKTAKSYLLDVDCHTYLPRLQGARPDHVRVKSSSCSFPSEQVSFDDGFDLWQVTRSPPIGKRI